MSLPDGVTTCLLTYGPITDTFGNLADSITVEVVADRTIVHAASGRTMFKHPVSVTAEGGGVAQLPVPHTDQAGFRDQQQNSLTGWYYTVTLTARFPGGGIESDRKTFQPLVGQVTRDADLLSSPGMVTPGVTVDGTAVTSVNGQTGDVDLTATFARVVDGVLVGPDGEPIEVGTSDILLSDTRPSSPAVGLVRIGLAFEDPDPEPEPSTPAADTFTRSDGSGLGASSGGQTWIESTGGTFGIASNQAVITGYGGPTGGGMAVIECGSADVTVSVNLAVVATQPGLVARYVDSSNFIRFGPDAALIKVGGVDTSLGSYSSAVSSGETLSVVLAGSSITVKRNGSTVLSATNSGLTSATKHGIALLATGSVADRWDNFTVTIP